jgi:hypothetical protein
LILEADPHDCKFKKKPMCLSECCEPFYVKTAQGKDHQRIQKKSKPVDNVVLHGPALHGK